MVEQWKSDGETYSVVGQWNSDGRTVLWNSGTVMVEMCGGTVEK